MIERLRTFPSPLRFALYAAAAVLLFFLAVGIGAAAAEVANHQFWTAPSGSAQTGSPEDSGMEATSSAGGSEGTVIEPSGDSASSSGKAHEASFVHQATDENSRGDYTYISDPDIDGNPNAVVLASPGPRRGSAGATVYEHNIGVWYEPEANQWAIFNQDRSPVPAGTSFRVVVPQASVALVHHARLSNTAGNYTYIDNRLTNGKPDVELSVTQNWNPGGGRGVYNDHPVDALYDAELGQWAVYNRDGAPMSEGAASNVAVSSDAKESER